MRKWRKGKATQKGIAKSYGRRAAASAPALLAPLARAWTHFVFGNLICSLVSALVLGRLFVRGNETSCHPPARWLRLCRRRSFAFPVNPFVRPRLMSERIRRRLFHSHRGPSQLLHARRAARVVSGFGSQESDQDPDKRN